MRISGDDRGQTLDKGNPSPRGLCAGHTRQTFTWYFGESPVGIAP